MDPGEVKSSTRSHTRLLDNSTLPAVADVPSEGVLSKEDHFKKRSESNLLKTCPFSEGALTIRELRREDVKAVKEICFNHFRSTGLAAARWELEQYIRHDCDDLRTAYETYMENGPQSRFWVAELALNCYGNCSSSDECCHKVIAGCVGLVPSKETANVGKLVRLIVDYQHRRMKIGSRLLMQVEQHASDLGFTDMRIYTNSLNPTHVKFVRQHGYTIAQTVRRGLMRGDLMTWHKRLPSATVATIPTAKASAPAKSDQKDGADVNWYKNPLLHKRDQSEFNLTITSAASHVMD